MDPQKGSKNERNCARTMIWISPEIQGPTVIIYTIVGTDREATHAFSLIVIHVHVGERDQPSIRVKGILARSLGCGISARQNKVEVFDLVEGRTRGMRWELLGHDGRRKEKGEKVEILEVGGRNRKKLKRPGTRNPDFLLEGLKTV